MMGQITCLICVSIACIYCLFAIHDRYKSSKKENKPEIIETPSYDEFCLKQYRSSVRSMCDCVQDNGEFWVYSSEYMVWQTGYKSADIKDIAIFITSTRNIYRPNEYELVLQTGIPLEHLESLYTRITYRVIVLKKYKKEIEPMDEKQKILNDIEEAQRKLDEARKKLDEYNTGYKRWKPKDGEYYHYVTGTLETSVLPSVSINKNYNVYNCFKTEDEALQEAEKILVRRQLEDIAKRLNKGEKIDWSDNTQCKFCITEHFTRCSSQSLELQAWYVIKNEGSVYCLDENFLDVAKREIGEDRLIKYIRGEG